MDVIVGRTYKVTKRLERGTRILKVKVTSVVKDQETGEMHINFVSVDTGYVSFGVVYPDGQPFFGIQKMELLPERTFTFPLANPLKVIDNTGV